MLKATGVGRFDWHLQSESTLAQQDQATLAHTPSHVPALQSLADHIGHIDGRTLAEEGLSPEVRNQRRAEGYIRGGDIPEPAMMVFNMQVAARGIQLLLAWITGLHAVNVSEYERVSFIGLAGSRRISLTRKHADGECPICSTASLICGAGDGHSMLVRARPR